MAFIWIPHKSSALVFLPNFVLMTQNYAFTFFNINHALKKSDDPFFLMKLFLLIDGC